MNVWEPLIFFPDEDEAEIKARFVEVAARFYGNPNFDKYDYAKWVFRDLREPALRAMQAADYWGKDIDIQQAILNLVNYKGEIEGKAKRIALLMSIAEDNSAQTKDRIAAIRVASELEGEITKAVEKKITHEDGGKPKQVQFLFGIDPKAGQPPEEAEDDIDE